MLLCLVASASFMVVLCNIFTMNSNLLLVDTVIYGGYAGQTYSIVYRF